MPIPPKKGNVGEVWIYTGRFNAAYPDFAGRLCLLQEWDEDGEYWHVVFPPDVGDFTINPNNLEVGDGDS